MTVANRSSAPTIQNLPANRSSMSHIPRSATAITPFGGFELTERLRFGCFVLSSEIPS